MGSIYISSDFHDHYKVVSIPGNRAGAIGLWVSSICWSSRNGTDGFIPTDAVKELVRMDGWGDGGMGYDALIAALLQDHPDRPLNKTGLFVAVDGGYRITGRGELWRFENDPEDIGKDE